MLDVRGNINSDQKRLWVYSNAKREGEATEMSGETELKPCPDGHEAEKRAIGGTEGRFLARCSRLDCGWRNVHMTQEQWNRRSTPPGALHAVSEIIMDAVSWHTQHFPRQCLGDIGPEAFDKFSAMIVDEIEKARQQK